MMLRVRKLRGFLMIEAVLMCLVFSLLGLSMMQITSGALSVKAAANNASTAQQLAETEGSFLRQLGFDGVAANGQHARKAVELAPGWESEVTLAPVHAAGGVRYRLAKVNVYRGGSSAVPECTIDVPLVANSDNERLADAQQLLTQSTARCESMLAAVQSQINGIKDCNCIAITVPYQYGSLTDNGSYQSPAWSNYNSSQLIMGGTTRASAAGTYYATFTPRSGYYWSGGGRAAKSVAWTIKVKPLIKISAPSQSGTLEANGGEQSPSWSGYNPSTMTMSGTTSASAEGTYYVTFTPKSGYCWEDGTTASKRVAWAIGAALKVVPVPTVTEMKFDLSQYYFILDFHGEDPSHYEEVPHKKLSGSCRTWGSLAPSFIDLFDDDDTKLLQHDESNPYTASALIRTVDGYCFENGKREVSLRVSYWYSEKNGKRAVTTKILEPKLQ